MMCCGAVWCAIGYYDGGGSDGCGSDGGGSDNGSDGGGGDVDDGGGGRVSVVTSNLVVYALHINYMGDSF